MPHWTEEEIEVLKEMWVKPEISLEDMSKVLKSRSCEGIRKKAYGLGLGMLMERRKAEIDFEYLQGLLSVKEI